MTPEQKLETEIKNHFFEEYYEREKGQEHVSAEKRREAIFSAMDADMPMLVTRYFNDDFWARRKAEMRQVKDEYNKAVQKAERDFQETLRARAEQLNVIEAVRQKFAGPRT